MRHAHPGVIAGPTNGHATLRASFPASYLQNRQEWLTADRPFEHAIPGVTVNESQAQLQEGLAGINNGIEYT